MSYMKTEVNSWCLSAEVEADLEREARFRKVPLSTILDAAVRDWLKKAPGRARAGRVWRSTRSAMKFYSFQIVIEKDSEDEGYFAYTPNVPGCFSNGKTIEETKRNIREAVEQHLASMLAHAQPVPQNDRLVHVEELTVAVPE